MLSQLLFFYVGLKHLDKVEDFFSVINESMSLFRLDLEKSVEILLDFLELYFHPLVKVSWLMDIKGPFTFGSLTK